MPEEINPGCEYSEALWIFQESVCGAVELHAKLRHLPHQGIAPTARLMFARITFVSNSISRLCPSEYEMKSAWDFTSIALLGRSLFESIMLFRYFTATTGQDECLARILVLHLHDRCERIRLFERLKRPEDVTNFRGEARNLKELLSTNPYFQTLDTKRQKEILNGSRPSILTLSEMGDRYAPDNDTWTIHQFLSHYAHSHPLGFMRNDDQGRDTLANEIDKLHIPGLLRWLSSLLEGSIEVYKQLLIGVRE